MNNKKIRRIDAKGRVVIPKDILEFLGFTKEERLVICPWKKDEVILRKVEECKDCEVIAFTRVDHQGRITIPKHIREEDTKVEIFLLNKCLILKGAH